MTDLLFENATTIIVIAFLILFLVGTPLFCVLGLTSVLCLFLIAKKPLLYLPANMFETTDSFPLVAIPFFILAGVLMSGGGISRRLVDFAKSLVGWIPGGLTVATVMACALFAAISGSSPATVVAIGMVMFPALMKENYPESISLGSITSAGSLGILIPPSIPMIIYGIVVGQSVTDLFIAGVVPGILIALLMSLYCAAMGIRGRMPRTPFSLREVGRSFIKGFWGIMLPVIILGGIYSGTFTVTEAAAVAVVYAFFVEIFIHKEMKIKKIPSLFAQAAVEMGAILIIIAVAISLSRFLTLQRVPHEIADFIGAHVHSKFGLLLAINALLIVIGCLMDIISAILIFAPLIYPIAESFGVNPIQLGIIFIVNLEIGYLTPPVGLNLFISSTIFGRPLVNVIKGVLPFIILMFAALMLITYYPPISLWLVDVIKK